MFSEKNLSKLIVFTPIFLIIITIVLLSFTQIQSHDNKLKLESKKLKERIVNQAKEQLTQKVNTLDDYIEYKKSTTERLLKNRIKKRVDIAYNIIHEKYNKDSGIKSQEKIKKSLKHILNSIRFENNGYYFIKEYKNKELTKSVTTFNNSLDNKDFNLKAKEFLKKQKDGYIQYKYQKPFTSNKSDKISYIMKFEPFNWLVGYGEYIDDIDKLIKKQVLQRLDSIRFENSNYVFTLNKDLKIIQHPFKKHYINKNLKEIKEFEKEYFDELLKFKTSKKQLDFFWLYDDKKLVALKYIKDWDWILVTSFDINMQKNINEFFGTRAQERKQFVSENIKVAILVIVIAVLITLLISKKIEQLFRTYKYNIETQKNALKNVNASLEEIVANKTRELENLNLELKQKVKKEVLKNRKKDQMLYNQSKMASMGEMIGNIAHQWRQPLSTISTIASGINLKIDFEIAKIDEIKDDLEGIVDTTKHLSQTIEDFRNFFSENKQKERFNIEDLMKKNINILYASMRNNHIEIIQNIQDVHLYGIKNELSQALLNILTNAKDVLIEKVNIFENKRVIYISIHHDETYAYINIKDNGGGIKSDILEKIFEPYFTTKHQSQGTGIGLFMTREIIVKHLKGEIEAKNVAFTHQGVNCLGACFYIKLPLNIEE